MASTVSQRSGRSSADGTRYGMPASRIFWRARVSRLAIVGSETSSARATSSVPRPHRVRRARATRVSGARLGWQQVKTSRSRSSSTTSGPGSSSGSTVSASDPNASGLLGPAGRLAADQVDRAAAGRGAQPRDRVVRDAVARPGLQRAQAGVLHGILGEREVAGPAGEGGEDVAAGDPDELGQGAVRVLGGERTRPRGDGTHIGNSMTGRTSTAPSQAPGMVAATRTASSRSAHSSR